jgi:hypothetical protein
LVGAYLGGGVEGRGKEDAIGVEMKGEQASRQEER